MKSVTGNMVPWWTPFVGDKEKEFVLEVLASQYLNEGLFVEKFENAVRDLLGARFAVATTSGTAALFLALKACDVGEGDEVIVPDITFIATANAVRLAGAIPVLVDVDPDTLNLAPNAVEKCITKRTKAIIPVHVSGRAVALPKLRQIAQDKALMVIEDAAEAFCGRFQGKALGTYGRAGCFSFSANKTITTGQGGMVVTNDESIYHRLRELKDHGRPVRGTGGDDIHHSLGFNFKMTNLQAAVGLGQLERLEERKKKMRNNYLYYREALSEIEELQLFGFNDEEVPQWTDAHSNDRDQLVHYLKENQIHCRKLWHPLHTQTPYLDKASKYPAASRIAQQSFWLPSSFLMTDAQLKRVCSLIQSHYQKGERRAA